MNTTDTPKLTQGFVQVYTGDGKGKTTAALGLAMRAAGAGLTVYVAQFLKKGTYHEHKALALLADHITIDQFGTGRFVRGKPQPDDLACARRGLDRVHDIIRKGACDLLILDEINVATAMGLTDLNEVLAVIDAKPPHMELVLTGRNAPAR